MAKFPLIMPVALVSALLSLPVVALSVVCIEGGGRPVSLEQFYIVRVSGKYRTTGKRMRNSHVLSLYAASSSRRRDVSFFSGGERVKRSFNPLGPKKKNTGKVNVKARMMYKTNECLEKGI